MGCFWYCDCNFKAPKTLHKDIMEMMSEELDERFIFDSDEDGIYIGFNDHSCYSLGEDFLSAVSNVAAEFELDGDCTIGTDEDEGNPPWKHTFEHGKTIEWDGETVYHKMNAKPFYWSCSPMHGMVWAETPAEAQKIVMENINEKSADDIAIYPVHKSIDTEFQMFDH